jgi:SAM-dependent methyltransferase
MSDWTREYFERGYAQRWGLLPVTDTIRRETSSLWDRFQLPSGARVVDLGCGPGRYALAFAGRGAKVVGVDSAVSLLRQARRVGVELGLPAHWLRGDIRSVPLRSGLFDVAVVIDAFGFFEAEDENEEVVIEAARLLVPGGGLVMKVVNGGPILAQFREADSEERDGTVVTISRTLALDPARMIEQVSVSGSRGNGRYERRQRLYRAEELSAAAKRAGLSVVDVFGDAHGARFEPAVSPTIWIIGQRGHAV